MKFRIITFLLAALFSVRAFAQTDIQTQSQGVMLSNAIQQAAASEAWMNVAGQTATTSIDNHREWTPKQGSVVLLEKCQFNLRVETVTPDKEVRINVVVANQTGDIVLEGYTSARATLVNGDWTLSKSAGEVVLRPPYINWLPFKEEVDQAWIVALDEKGDEQWYEQAVNGRKVGFARDSMGLKNAYLRVHFRNGKVSAWTIDTGVPLESVPISAKTTAKLGDNFHSFKNTTVGTTAAVVVIPVQRGSVGRSVGVTPSIEIDLTAAGSAWVKISTSAGKIPVGYRVLSPSEKWSVPNFSLNAGGAVFPLEAGKSYVVPVFSDGDLDEMPYPVQTGASTSIGKSGE